jgi:ectoine hydroxylase-related dioxygenase (phytanoyl-CoA dioxygenase family)
LQRREEISVCDDRTEHIDAWIPHGDMDEHTGDFVLICGRETSDSSR